MPPEILAHAVKLIRQGYSTGWPLARTPGGRPVAPTHPSAASWSLQGAFIRASYDLRLHHVMQTARCVVADRLWTQYKIHIAWAELDPRMTQAIALSLFE